MTAPAPAPHPAPDRVAVPVNGGDLTVGVWNRGAGPVVLAAHGITGNHTCWAPLVRALGRGVTVVAPDLRGRGGSATLGPPFGMETHAEDVVAVLDHLGVARAVVVGHSMGGFVADALGAKHPDRVRHTILVDGGLPVPVPEHLLADVDAALSAVIGPALDRLQQTFTSREEYVQWWSVHPAFTDGRLTDDVVAYVNYDLGGEAPNLRSTASLEAVRADARDTFVPDRVAGWFSQLGDPVTFIRAARGMLDQPDGLYPTDVVDAAKKAKPRMDAHTVTGVNHYTIVLGETGANAIAGRVRAALEGQP